MIMTIMMMVSVEGEGQGIDEIIDNYAREFPSERVYVQLDNNEYLAGDTIWYKGYIMANENPTYYSKSLYVDWYDGQGREIAHQVYLVERGVSIGQYAIPADYKGSRIYLLAYTRWMLNDGDSSGQYLYHREISVINGERGEERKEEKGTNIAFFPEGGNLIAGVRNRIAFKATDDKGNPVKVKGEIKDREGEKVTGFAGGNEGMGYFYLEPVRGEQYRAECDTGGDKPLTVEMPESESLGVSMEVEMASGKRRVIIRRNETDTGTCYLLVTMNGLVDYLAKIRLQARDSAIMDIPVGDVPTGILTFTVMDRQWNRLAERISFVRGNEEKGNDDIQISSIRKDLGKRGYNSVEISSKDSVMKNLSVSVTDGDITSDTASDIRSWLLLEGWLKRRVKDAAGYFRDTGRQKEEQLDLEMMTNGWQRYRWKEIIGRESKPVKYKADRAYYFFGGEIEKEKKMPEEVTFLIKGNGELGEYRLGVGRDGRFSDSGLVITDSATVVCERDKNRKGVSVSIDRLPGPEYSTYPDWAGKVGEGEDRDSNGNGREEGDINYTRGGKLLPDVKVYGTRKTEMDKIEDKYASDVFKNENGYRLYLEDKPELRNNTSVLEMLKGRIPGFNWNPINPPAFFVDEMSEPFDAVRQLPLVEIAFVKYYPRHFVLSPGGGKNGTLAIYTKRFPGDEPGRDNQDGVYHITGYNIAEKFYKPDYGGADKAVVQDDRRKTLLWEPSIEIGKDHKSATITFYNTDHAKRLRVIVEGMSDDGTLIHKEMIIKLK